MKLTAKNKKAWAAGAAIVLVAGVSAYALLGRDKHKTTAVPFSVSKELPPPEPIRVIPR